MHPFKYIVFDFDGTIADSGTVFLTLYNQQANKHGYAPLTEDNLQLMRAMSIKERCKALGVPLYKIPFLASAIIKQYKASVGSLQFNEGMKELLQSLDKNNVRYAVLSSNSKENISSFFSSNGIVNDEIFCSRSIFGKHVLINKFLKQKGLKPSDILYVGDELRDVIACRKSGVDVAWVSWGYDSQESLVNNKPDYYINSPAQILLLALSKSMAIV